MNQTDERVLELDVKEVRALYRIIKNEWINGEDDEVVAVTDKISEFIDKHGEIDA